MAPHALEPSLAWHLFIDNQSVIVSANAQTLHARTKHIDIHYHFIHEWIASNEVQVTHRPTEENIADVFTQALPRPRFQTLVARMGLRPCA